MGDVQRLALTLAGRDVFVVACGDELDVAACWALSPLGHSAHVKKVLKRSTAKVGIAGLKSHRSLASSRSIFPLLFLYFSLARSCPISFLSAPARYE